MSSSAATGGVTSSYTEGVPNSAFILRSFDGNTWSRIDNSGAVWNSLYIDKNDKLYALGSANQKWTVRRSIDNGTTWSTIDNYTTQHTGSAYTAIVDDNDVLFVGGTVSTGSAPANIVPKKVWLIRSSSFSGSDNFGDVNVFTGSSSGENICYTLKSYRTENSYQLLAAGIINNLGDIKATRTGSNGSIVVGSSASWERQFSPGIAGVTFDLDVEDVDALGVYPNKVNIYLLQPNRVRKFVLNDELFSVIQTEPLFENGNEQNFVRRFIRDPVGKYLYYVGGTAHKTSSFFEPNCWNISRSKFLVSTQSQSFYLRLWLFFLYGFKTNEKFYKFWNAY